MGAIEALEDALLIGLGDADALVCHCDFDNAVDRAHTDAHIVKWSGDSALRRITFYDQTKARDVASHFHPGTTLLVTDASAPRTTRTSAKDFSIITSDPPA